MNEPENTRSRAGALGRFFANCRDMTERDRRNVWLANAWLFGWVLSSVGVRQLIQHGMLENRVFTWLAIAVSTGLGVLAMRAYARFIREADELLRKIQTEALALGFAAALVGNFTLALITRATGHRFDLADLLLLMVAGYLAGTWAGARRYA